MPVLNMPKYTYHVCENLDGDYHILRVDDNGGYVICDNIYQLEDAEFIAESMNKNRANEPYLKRSK